jgi:hypothetical protein
MNKPPNKPHDKTDPFSGEFSDKIVRTSGDDLAPRMVPKYLGEGRGNYGAGEASVTIWCGKTQIPESAVKKSF